MYFKTVVERLETTHFLRRLLLGRVQRPGLHKTYGDNWTRNNIDFSEDYCNHLLNCPGLHIVEACNELVFMNGQILAALIC